MSSCHILPLVHLGSKHALKDRFTARQISRLCQSAPVTVASTDLAVRSGRLATSTKHAKHAQKRHINPWQPWQLQLRTQNLPEDLMLLEWRSKEPGVCYHVVHSIDKVFNLHRWKVVGPPERQGNIWKIWEESGKIQHDWCFRWKGDGKYGKGMKLSLSNNGGYPKNPMAVPRLAPSSPCSQAAWPHTPLWPGTV